jgi:hypothetical protein
MHDMSYMLTCNICHICFKWDKSYVKLESFENLIHCHRLRFVELCPSVPKGDLEDCSFMDGLP